MTRGVRGSRFALRASLLLLACAALGAGEAGVVLGVRGALRDAQVAVVASGVTAGGTAVSWNDLSAFALPRPISGSINSGVVTREGAILRGLPIDTDKGTLRWTTDAQGPRSDPLDSLAVVILGPLELAGIAGLLGGPPGVQLGNGERVNGTLSFINGEAVGVDTGRRVAQIPRARVAAVVLRPLAAASAPRCWLALANGERVLAGGPVEVPLAAVVAGWGEGPGRVLLSAVAPKRSVASDRIGATLPVRPGIGFPSLVGGLATPHGVRLPARGEIAWDASGASQLLAWVACPAGGAEVVAAVALDGAVAWEQTLQPGAPAIAIAVPLKGAGEVALRAAPGADGETAQRLVVWGMPSLVK